MFGNPLSGNSIYDEYERFRNAEMMRNQQRAMMGLGYLSNNEQQAKAPAPPKEVKPDVKLLLIED